MLETRPRLAAMALLLVAASSCWLAIGAEQQSLLARVCRPSGSAETPIFTSPSEVRALIEQQRTSQDGTCESRFQEAFSELAAVVEAQQLKDVCSPQMYQLIRSFHAKFIHFYLPESTRDELARRNSEAAATHQMGAPIPEALRNFFILFAKQVGATCKQHLVAAMQRDPMIGNDDFAVLERYKQESSRLGPLYELTKMGMSQYGRNKAAHFNELQIVDLLAARVADSSLEEGAKLYVQVRFDDQLKRLKSACKKRFMPVYMELFAPVIRLNNLGYIERAKSTLEDRVLNEDKSIRRWHLIIQACEVLKDIEVLHDSSAMSAIVGIIQDNSHLGSLRGPHEARPDKVKILSTEEARQLRERVQQAAEQVRPSYDPEPIEVRHERVPFTPRMWLLQPREVKRELAHFQKDIEHYVWQRTSRLKEWRDSAMMAIKHFYRAHKNQIVERDQSSALGRLTRFFERHRALLMGISIILNIIFLSTVMAG